MNGRVLERFKLNTMEDKIILIEEPNIVHTNSGTTTVSGDRFHRLWEQWACGNADYKYLK